MTAAPVIDEFQARVAAARNGDLGTFSLAVHDEELEPHQEAWAEALDTMNKVVLVCPPDTRKSTTVQRWVEREIGLNPEVRILWLMNAGDQAMRRVISVSATLRDNPIFKGAFKVEANPNAQWTKTQLYVKRKRSGPDPTFLGCGLNGPYQGSHFDIIIIDDPTDPRDVLSPATMEAQRMLMRGMISDRLADGGRIIVILTRWGENDLVPTYEQMGYQIVEMPIVGNYPWGPTISNNLFPMRRCDEIRFRAGPGLWQLTYMCNPRGLQRGLIPESVIQYWDQTNLPSGANIAIMAFDPAASIKTWADPSCIGTGLLDFKTRAVYVTDMWTEKMEFPDVEDEFKKRAERTARLAAIGVETVGFQLSFLQRLRREKRYPVVELPYRSRRQSTLKARGLDRDKTGRALSVAQKFRDGKLFLPRKLPLFEGVSIEEEITSFPLGKHDDRLDVLSFLCALADAYSVPRGKVRIGIG